MPRTHFLTAFDDLTVEQVQDTRTKQINALLEFAKGKYPDEVNDWDIKAMSPTDLGLADERFRWTSGANIDVYTSYIAHTLLTTVIRVVMPTEIHDPSRGLTGLQINDHLNKPVEKVEDLENFRELDNMSFFFPSNLFLTKEVPDQFNLLLRSDLVSLPIRVPVKVLIAEPITTEIGKPEEK